MTWLDLIGWLGSALLVFSVMQARVLRFRALNLAACLVLAGFNAALEIWPMVAMNIALMAINLWHLRSLLQTRNDTAAYTILEVGSRDTYLLHILDVHAADIARFQPDLAFDNTDPSNHAFILQRGEETVGVVLVRIAEGQATVLLDYVTPRYRDFSPGQFVWRNSAVLGVHGVRSVITSPKMVGAYYARLGFTARPDGSYELKVPVTDPPQPPQ